MGLQLDGAAAGAGAGGEQRAEPEPPQPSQPGAGAGAAAAAGSAERRAGAEPSCSRSAMTPATKPILEAASEFLWSDELQSSLDSFSTNHAPMFADATGVEGEQKLEWTQAHL